MHPSKRRMKRILLFSIVVIMAMISSALPEWPRKYATTIVRGRVANLPKDMGEILSVNILTNLHRSLTPDDIDEYQENDGVRTFSVRWPMCWPEKMNVTVCNYTLQLPLCPGDTIDIELDYQRLQQVKGDVRRVFQEAIKVSGESLYRSPACIELAGKLALDAAVIDEDYMKEHCRADFKAYREWRWAKHLKRLKQVKAAKLKKEEKEYLRLEMEKYYIESLYGYKFMMMHILKCDSTEMAADKAQFCDIDPHATSLEFPKHINNAYCFGLNCLNYLEANGLDDLPLGKYLRERQQAEAVVAQLKAFRPVSETEINGLSPEFLPPVIELQQKIAKQMKEQQSAEAQWKPTGESGTWLKQITERHAGHVVFIDLWATWCGPCQKGIREMASVKENYEKRGVDFVYITDNSSSIEGFLDLQKKHTGDHFLFLKEEIRAMHIPGYSGSIPHYLIYGRDGELVKYITGWGGLESMKQELNKALEE